MVKFHSSSFLARRERVLSTNAIQRRSVQMLTTRLKKTAATRRTVRMPLLVSMSTCSWTVSQTSSRRVGSEQLCLSFSPREARASSEHILSW